MINKKVKKIKIIKIKIIIMKMRRKRINVCKFEENLKNIKRKRK
jgi:hypothetical protein